VSLFCNKPGVSWLKCPECGTENLNESIFCDDCGANLKKTEDSNIMQLEPLAKGTIINEKYEITDNLETGTMNKYKALDKKSGKEVIMWEHIFREKPTSNVDSSKFTTFMDTDSFGRVSLLFKDMEHPNLIKVLDYFQDKDKSYLIEEFFSSETLQDRIHSENFELDELQTLNWWKSLCDALTCIHKHEIIHRNLHPANIYINSENEIKISGFDRARIKEESGIDLRVNHGFTAPEGYGVGKGTINETSDIFSVAAIIYKIIAGNKFNPEQQGPYMNFPKFKDIDIRLHYPDMETIIFKALANEQEKRYTSAEELAMDIVATTEKPPVKFVDKGVYIRLRGSMKTDVGKVREINQDSMLSMQLTMNECCEFTQPHLFIVADGMGGVADGEVASSMAIRSVATHVARALLDRNCVFPIDAQILGKAVENANAEIYTYAQEEPSRKGMGSTITASLLMGNRLIIAHVGDTRAYVMNSKSIKQITEDHSLIGRLLKMGQLTPEEAKNSPQKNLIYRALGTNPQIEVDLYQEQFEPGDIALICCDGMWDYFTEEELHRLVTSSRDFDKTTSKLIELANERGGKDNITVIIFQLVSIEYD